MVSPTPNSTRSCETKDIGVSDLCRICMLPGDYFKNCSHEITVRICKMLKTSTQIDVSVNDGYPQIMCNNCFKQLYESYKFVLLAKSTQRELRKNQTFIESIKEKSPIFESKANTLSPIKENIDLNSNPNIAEQKNNDLAKIKNSTPNKDSKRSVLRSSIKKEDVIFIENNNSIDLIHSPLDENLPKITETLPNKRQNEGTTSKLKDIPDETPNQEIPEKKRRSNEKKGPKSKENGSVDTAIPTDLDLNTSETLLNDKKRRSNEKKGPKPKENGSVDTVIPIDLEANNSETFPIDKKRRSNEKKGPKPKENSSNDTAISVDLEDITETLSNKKRLNEKKVKSKENSLVDTTIPIDLESTTETFPNKKRLNEKKVKPKENETKIEIEVIEEPFIDLEAKKEALSPIDVETATTLENETKKRRHDRKKELESSEAESKRRFSDRVASKTKENDVKIDLTLEEIKEEKVSPEENSIPAETILKENTTRKSTKVLNVSKPNQKRGFKKKDEKLVQTSIASFYSSSPEKSPKKELSPSKTIMLPDKKRSIGQFSFLIDKCDLSNEKPPEMIDSKPVVAFQKVEKRKRNSVNDKPEGEKRKKQKVDDIEITEPKRKKKIISKKVVVTHKKNTTETKFKKKVKKTFIKINTKYLTRTIKGGTAKEGKKKTVSSPKKDEVLIKTEPISKLDDILSAVGLIRKKSVDSDKHECEICKMKFVWTESYRRHLASRHKLQPYPCRYCTEKFSSALQLRNHRNQAHEAQMNRFPYKCKQCEACFKTFDDHLVHVREVHNQKPKIMCTLCKADFETQEELDEHLQRHQAIKEETKKIPEGKLDKHNVKIVQTKFQCEHCSKLFRKTSDLVRHVRVHTGEKPFACKLCNQKFQQRPNLQKHIITVHAEKKSFTCDICLKSFGRHDSLLRHMLTHSIEKPFTCQECKKAFVRQSQLDTHFKRFHSGKNLIENEN